MRVSQRFLHRPIQMQQAEKSEPFFASKQESDTTVAKNPFFAPAPTVQTKLEVNAPGDQYEQEADAMAERVVQRSAAPLKEDERIQKMDKPMEEEQVQRKCSGCEEEDANVQRKSDGSSVAPSNVTQQIHNTKGNGTKLPAQTRSEMESSFGTNFSDVRIHDNSQAAEMSDSLHAHAFTHGSDIYFNQGKFAPESSDGKRLLAHELTHVVQQGVSEVKKKIQRDRRGDRETDREEERGRRRRDTLGGRGRGEGLAGDLDSDWVGRAILGRWLLGTGDWYIISNPSWSSYMKASGILKEQIAVKTNQAAVEGLTTAATLGKSSFAIYKNFAAEVENGEGIIGYQYLHGTNADVGGFAIWGEGTITNYPNGIKLVSLNLTFQWNDIIDPNPKYASDNWKSMVGEILTLGQAESYEIHISWQETAYIVADENNNISSRFGYPF